MRPQLNRKVYVFWFIERLKKDVELALGPGAQRTFRLSSHTPRIPFNF